VSRDAETALRPSGSAGLRAAMRSRAAAVGLLIGVPISAVFLWLAFRDADPREVWSVLTTARLAPVALAVVAVAGVYVIQAARWRAIARTPEVPTRDFCEMVVSGVAVNNVLPGRIGDLLRARWLQVAAGVSGGRAFATVLVDRAFDVFALVVALAISLPFVAGEEWLRRIASGGLALLLIVVLVFAAARIYTRRHVRDRRTDRALVRRLVRDTLEGLSAPLGRRRAAVLGLVSMAAWAMWAVAAWLVARALGIELSVLETVLVAAVINLGVAIPSSPGFVGTYQWLAVASLALFGVGANEGLAFGVLMQAVWYVPTTLVGGALLLRRTVDAVRLEPRVRTSMVEAGDG
jgi:glycosyltransferase 2 family protein